jgi:hypothetical protein
MLKDILKRAVAEAMHGRRKGYGYGYEKPFKRKKGWGYGPGNGFDDRYERGYRHDGWYGSDRYGEGRPGYRGGGGGLKGMLMSALMSWLSRRR